jgi:hypothetical protein
MKELDGQIAILLFGAIDLSVLITKPVGLT